MIKTVRLKKIASVTTLLLFGVSPAFASESLSSISIKNYVNSTTSTSYDLSTSKSECHITIIQNGKTTEKDCSGDQNVDMKSEDGNSQIHIRNSVNGTETPSKPTKPNTSTIHEDWDDNESSREAVREKEEKKKEELKKKLDAAKKEVENKKFDIQAFVKLIFSRLFSMIK